MAVRVRVYTSYMDNVSASHARQVSMIDSPFVHHIGVAASCNWFAALVPGVRPGSRDVVSSGLSVDSASFDPDAADPN